MKKYFFFALTAAMMSFAGCQEMEQEAPVNPNESGSTFEFVADIAQTKTTLDVEKGYKVDWEEGDVVYMVTSDGTWGAAYGDDQDAKTIAEFKYADGKFTSEATIANGKYTFKGMYAAASQKSFHRGASSTHKLEATQAQNCANPTAHIKANDALVGTFTATVPMAEMAKMNMSHLYTLMQVNVKNVTGAPIVVTKFEMTAEGADLAAIFNVTAFDTPAITTKEKESSTITVNLTGGSVEDEASLPVYFVMAPLKDYAGDVTFKVTDSEGNTYTKTVTMNGITFEAGKYNTTTYTIKEADVVEPDQPGETTEAWTLVTDASTLAVGDKIVIVASASNHAMGADKGNNRNAASITKSGNTVVINDDVQIITLEAGKVSNTFAFNTGEGYLYAASSSNNYLKTKAQLDNNGSWAITITSTGVATIKSQGTYTRNWIRKNSSSALFACYASGQSDVSIYKLVGGSSEGGGETPAAPVISVTSETTIEVPAAGGNINIEWSVAPSVEDVYLEATEHVDWISPVTRSTVSGNLQYTVEENSGEARTATITLSYAGAESKIVTVKQAAKVEVDDSFEPGEYWIIQTEANLAMKPLTGNYGYPGANLARIVEGSYKSFAANIFVIEYVAEDKCYAIKDSSGKYLYMKLENDSNWYKSFNVSADYVSDPKYQWAISANDEGKHIITNLASQSKIAYSAQHSSWGAYADISSYALPTLVKVTDPLAVELDSINVTGQTTSFTEGEEFKFGGTVTANYNDGSTKDVTANVSVTTPDMVDGAEVTVSYTDGNVTKTVTYKITVKAASQEGGDSDEPVVIFYESFDNQNKTGGNDGNFASSGSDKISITGWTLEYAYAAKQCIKLGGSSNLGSATTPSLGQAGNMTLTFKAAAWNNNKEKTTMKVSISGGGTLSSTTVNISKTKWTDVTIDITGATASSQIKFEGAQKSNGRFFLDEVKVVEN